MMKRKIGARILATVWKERRGIPSDEIQSEIFAQVSFVK